MYENYNFLKEVRLYLENNKNLEGDYFYDIMVCCYGKYDEVGWILLC